MSRRLSVLFLLLALLALAGQPALGAAARQSASAGDITGTVKDSAGRAVPNARVRIQTGPVAGEARTDRSGKYTLADLPPGSYDLLASKPAYDPQFKGRVTVVANAAATANFTIQWGNQAAGGVEVFVSAANGAPLPQAMVQLFTNGVQVDQVPTDAAGSAVFPGLLPGVYNVSAQRPGFFSAGSQNAQVRAGTMTAFSLQLRQDSSQTGNINGTIRTADGAPINNATVKIIAGVSTGQAKTDGSGTYRLTKLVPGVGYSLQVSAAGFATQSTGSLTVTALQTTFRDVTLIKQQASRGSITGLIHDNAGATLPFTTVRITAGPGLGREAIAGSDGRYTFTDLDPGDGYALQVEQSGYSPVGQSGIKVEAGKTITVDFELRTQGVSPGRISGVVRDSASGAALSGVTVEIIQGGSTGLATQTDGSGSYLLDGLIPGNSYALRFSLTGYQVKQIGDIQVINGLTSSVDAQLAPDQTQSGVIAGTVRKGGVNALSGVKVTLFAGPSSPISTTTNAQGKYQFNGLRVGTGYSVRAEKSGFKKVERTGFEVKNGQTTVVDFTLVSSTPTTGSISGRITDLGSRPIAGATVRALTGPTTPVPFTTDVNGNYVIDNLQPGVYSVQVVANGFANGQQDNVRVNAGANATVNFQLLQP